jgi:hypothetical protein
MGFSLGKKTESGFQIDVGQCPTESRNYSGNLALPGTLAGTTYASMTALAAA